MINEKKIWQDAFEYVRQLGKDAEWYVRSRCSEIRETGDGADHSAWTLVLEAVQELLVEPEELLAN